MCGSVSFYTCKHDHYYGDGSCCPKCSQERMFAVESKKEDNKRKYQRKSKAELLQELNRFTKADLVNILTKTKGVGIDG